MTCARRSLHLAAAALGAAFALTAADSVRAQTIATATGDVQRMSDAVTVESIDPATRRMVVKRSSGDTVSIKVPDGVRNLENLKPGDKITATYYREVAVTLSEPNTPLPDDTAAMVARRAPEGDRPGGVAASRLVVSGAILGIDLTNHVLRVVNPQGGEVHEIAVIDPKARALMAKMKVGDRVTATVNEGLLISATPG